MTWLLLLLLTPNASADRMMERLCFNSQPEAQKAIPILNFILVKGQDEVHSEGNCLNVVVDSSRGELFQRWVRTRLPNAQYSFSTIDTPAPECDMVLKKIGHKNQTTQSGQVGQNQFQVNTGTGVTETTEQSMLKVTSGKTAGLRVDSTDLEITCTVRANSTYHLKFALKFIPKEPIVPNVPPGTTVIINSPQPPDQSGPSISTEVEARPGQDINVGQISKDLNSKSHDISVPKGVALEKATGIETTQWILTIR